MVAYQLPQYMPGAVPVAFNGGGTFYLLDMRQPAVGGEYPVVCAHAGYLSWEPDACCVVADSFVAACRGTVNVDDLSHPEAVLCRCTGRGLRGCLARRRVPGNLRGE